MITDLWIENFKGIGKRQHIPLRPITLLFGTNSAGKSTVLHALLYLREILVNGELDPTHQLDGENTVSLGGFHSVIHKQGGTTAADLSLTARWRLSRPQRQEWISKAERSAFEEKREHHRKYGRPEGTDHFTWQEDFDELFPEMSLDQLCKHAPKIVDVTISISAPNGLFEYESGRPRIAELRIDSDEQPFVSATMPNVDFGEGEDQVLFGYVNLMHTCWQTSLNPEANDSNEQKDPLAASGWAFNAVQSSKLESFAKLAEGTAGKMVLVTRILEVPQFHDLSTANEAESNIVELMKSDEFHRIPLPVFLAGIRPIELQEEELAWISEPATATAFVLLNKDTEKWSKEDWRISYQPSQLVGLVFTDSFDCSENSRQIIDCIRSYIFDPESTAFSTRGKWVCAVQLEADRFGLPILDDDELSFGIYRDLYQTPRSASTAFMNSRQGYVQRRLSIPPEPSARHAFDDDIKRTILQPIRWLRDYLRDRMKYVGPKRSTVPRLLTKNNAHMMPNWGNGLAAWRCLLNQEDNFVKRASNYLTGEQWLDTKYEIARNESIQCEPPSCWPSQIDFGDLIVEEKPIGDLVELLKSGELTQEHLLAFQSRLKKCEEQLKAEEEKLSKLSERPSTMRAFLTKQNGASDLHPQDVGEGITQVIPVIVAEMQEGMILIEQPELHLHPSVAAKLGDVIIDARLKAQNGPAEGIGDSGADFNSRSQDSTLIETHSEHLILRILRRIRQTTDGELQEHIPPIKPDDVCVLWVDNLGQGTIFKRLEINKFGDFIDRWPRGFFTERSEELF